MPVPSPGSSLVAQRLNGIERGGLPRRVKAEEHPTAAEKPTARARPGSGFRAPAGEAPDKRRAADAHHEPDHPAEQAHHDALDEELREHVASRARRSAMRMPISRVRSVTDTSMMFMIPMPPTSSETDAIAASSHVIIVRGARRRLGDLGLVAHGEVVVAAVRCRCASRMIAGSPPAPPRCPVGDVRAREDLPDAA